MRTYKTRPWLWFAASLIVLIIIGAVMPFSCEGARVSPARFSIRCISSLLTGREEAYLFPFLLFWVAPWGVIAATIGWLLQSIVVVASIRKREKAKPSA